MYYISLPYEYLLLFPLFYYKQLFKKFVIFQQPPVEVRKRLDEVRLLESRKSARLADQDTDFARLADMAGERKTRMPHHIDMPFTLFK